MSRSGEADDPRRRTLIQALTLGLFSGAVVGVSPAQAQSFFGTSPAKLPPGQSIYRINGDVTVNDMPATLKTPINANDTVKTGKNSEVVFVVGGNSMILRSDSNLTLTPRDAAKDNFLVGTLRLVQGAILSVSRNAGMQVRTPAATIGIRGTGFYLESDPERSYFCTCYGVTETVSNVSPNDTAMVEATHHDRPLYILAKGPEGKTIRDAPFINHTDPELLLIETLVGRTPPWVFPGDLYNAPRRDY
jgi:hypothetical protein